MKNVKAALITFSLLVTTLFTSASAQNGYDPMMVDPMAQVEQLLREGELQLQQQRANYARLSIDYYRQQTGDYTTPDAQAALLGETLWCQNNPAPCQQLMAQGHAQRMQSIQSWGQTALQNGQTYSDILDMQHQGYMNRSAMTSEGQANYIQGAIYGESTFANPNNGVGYSLPIYPDPSMNYTTPEGYPLSYDYQTGTWYQGDGNGWWVPLNQQR